MNLFREAEPRLTYARLLPLAIFALGCRGARSGGVAAVDAAADTVFTPSVSSSAVAVRDDDAAASPDTVVAPRAIDVDATLDGETVKLAWGYAYAGYYGVVVELFSEPVDTSRCRAARLGLSPTFTGARVSFEVPPGPSGTFFAEHPIGVEVRLDAPERKMRAPATPLEMPYAFQLSPPSVSLTLESFHFAPGAHVRGTIDGAETMLVGSGSARGKFDVEVCPDSQPSTFAGLRADAPPTRARGNFGSRVLAPKTVHAIVQQRPRSKDEAIDLAIGRTQGGLADTWMLVFHAAADVPCPNAKDLTSTKNGALLHVQGIGGAGVDHDFSGTTQPATVVLHDGEEDFAATWPGWVKLDALHFEPGTTLTGTLWAASMPDAHSADEKGAFGGRFEAIVCAP
jgi:hypothetical protein